MKTKTSSKVVPGRLFMKTRSTLRICLGMHIDFLEDLVQQLDEGARLGKVLKEWKRDCGAVRYVDVPVAPFDGKPRGRATLRRTPVRP